MGFVLCVYEGTLFDMKGSIARVQFEGEELAEYPRSWVLGEELPGMEVRQKVGKCHSGPTKTAGRTGRTWTGRTWKVHGGVFWGLCSCLVVANLPVVYLLAYRGDLSPGMLSTLIKCTTFHGSATQVRQKMGKWHNGPTKTIEKD